MKQLNLELSISENKTSDSMNISNVVYISEVKKIKSDKHLKNVYASIIDSVKHIKIRVDHDVEENYKKFK